MSPRPAKIQKSEWHKNPVNPKLAIGFLVTFAFLVGIYLVASFKAAAVPEQAAYNNPGSSNAGFYAKRSEAENSSQMNVFSSSDDFKSYLDDGKRAFGAGIYEEQVAASIAAASAAAAKANPKAVAPKNAPANQKAEVGIVSQDDASKYMSLGKPFNGKTGDIILAGPKNIYFSPENQYYAPAVAAAADSDSQLAGETKIFDVGDPASTVQVGTVPRDGDLVLVGNTLAIVSGNSISAYDVSSVFMPRELWKTRINEGTGIVTYKSDSSKLYLALRTQIDAANPCPIKPLTVGDKPLIIECGAIFHPKPAILADTIFTVVEIDAASGQVARNLSFVGNQDNSTVLLADKSIIVVWGQGGDYISFFTGFLQDKCKGLLPNYLLDKVAKLPGCAISRPAKELELRSLLSNWFESLSADEQTRVADEITGRLNDYLRDHYRDFEQTGLARAGMNTFSFDFQNQVAGRLMHGDSMDVADGNLRIATVSGDGAAKEMAWLVTGKIAADDSQKKLSNIYVLNQKLEITASGENLELPASICALRYAQNAAFASTCRQNDPIYVLGLNSAAAGLAGKLDGVAFPSHIYPFADGYLLAVEKSDRKIKLVLYDATMPTKIEKASELDVNDYWADFDGNYQAFAADDANKMFFLPVARGGYIFSRVGGKVALVAAASGIATSRAVFAPDYLYLAGDEGIDVFGGINWAKIKSIKF